MRIREGLPVQRRRVERQVVGQIDAAVALGRHRPHRVLELQLMHVDGDVGRLEVLEPARVVQVQMPDDDGFDVRDRVPRCCDRRG